MSEVTTTPTKVEVATRPYTSYNLFFQLEREYILQTLLEYKPNIIAENTNIRSNEDIFHPTNIRSNYQGCPPLPSRYANLILPFDWHIPGKTHRRKRLHRKSHGMIGFHELNEQISQAWRVADEDVKDFCSRLSEIEAKKYGGGAAKTAKTNKTKKAMKKKKTNKRKKAMKESKTKLVHTKTPTVRKVSINEENEPSMMDDDDEDLFSFDWSHGTDLLNKEDIPFVVDAPSSTTTTASSSQIISRAISHENIPQDDSIQVHHHHYPIIKVVDMKDDEIMDIWKSIPLVECTDKNKNTQKEVVNNDNDIVAVTPAPPSISPSFQVCVEIPTFSFSKSNSSSSMLVQPEVVTPQKNRDPIITPRIQSQKIIMSKKTSFNIDEEYDKFREIGKQFLLLRRGGLKRRGYAACQA
jgi:hypothetical protein